jgi:2-methylcitrate dehydratase
VDKSTQTLVDYAASFRFEALPAEVVHETKRKFIDTLGCALGAFHAEPARIARAMARRSVGNPPARILGTLESSTPEMAAFANGAAIRFLDYNDSYLSKASCHPSDVWPAILAVADAAHAGGKAVIAGAALAYDVSCNFADIAEREQGWDNVFYDLVGSAVGCGNVLGLNAHQLEHAVALAIVPNVPLGQTRLGELSMWKGCAAANAARNGAFAALLAQEGMTGPEDVIEGKWGLWNQLNCKSEWAPFGGRGSPYRIARTHIKYFLGVVHAQSPMTAALELHRQVKVEDIESVVIETYWVAKRYVKRDSPLWHPTTSETADHSIPYLVAAALIDGKINAATLDEKRIHDPRLLALMGKMSVRENPEFEATYPGEMQCRIEVTTRSGERKSAHVRYFKGHAQSPVTDAEIEAKFRTLTADTVEPKVADAFLAKAWQLDQLKDVGDVLSLCRVKDAGR